MWQISTQHSYNICMLLNDICIQNEVAYFYMAKNLNKAFNSIYEHQ